MLKKKKGNKADAAPKRSAPSGKTLRELFLKSGNLCAYPSCNALMMNNEGEFIGQICHIEAAGPGGQRFNPNMTDEERADIKNLMLLCYPHHVKTNDVKKFTVERLRKMKADHERTFASPERALIKSLTDTTTLVQPRAARNLKRFNRVMGYTEDNETRAKSVAELRTFLARFRDVPFEVRKFLGVAATRVDRIKSRQVLAYDMQSALDLPITRFKRLVEMAEQYQLASVDPDGEGQYFFSLDRTLEDVAAFCKKEAIDIDTFTIQLRFDQLDD